MNLRRQFIALTTITVATLFSGCEVFTEALSIVFQLLSSQCAHSVKLSLEWIAEIHSWKREFICARRPPKAAFGDIVEMSNQNWKGKDYISGDNKSMWTTNVCVAGFECDTVCRLRTAAPTDASSCMENASGKTGTTGRATLLCIIKFRFPLTLLENSAILGAENINFIIEYLNYFGFFVHPWTLKAEDYKSPVRRERQYLAVIPLALESIDQLDEGFVKPAYVAEFTAALSSMVQGQGSPNDFLLPKSSPDYMSYHQTAIADRAIANHKAAEKLQSANMSKAVDKLRMPPPPLKKAKTIRIVGVEKLTAEEWEADHLDMYRSANMPWPPNIDIDDPELYAAVLQLPVRMQQAAYYHVHRKREDPYTHTFHDLNPTLKFDSEMPNILQTTLCTSVMFDRKAKKVLSGLELLLFNGMPYDVATVTQESNSHYTELGGNMFNAFALCPIIIGFLLVGLFADNQFDGRSHINKGDDPDKDPNKDDSANSSRDLSSSDEMDEDSESEENLDSKSEEVLW